MKIKQLLMLSVLVISSFIGTAGEVEAQLGIGGTPVSIVVAPDKFSYAPGETISISYAGNNGGSWRYVYVFISLNGVSFDTNSYFHGVGMTYGTWYLSAPTTPGTYQISFMVADGGNYVAYLPITVVAPASCYPWGMELPSGQSIAYYSAQTVTPPGVCTGGTFTCSNGALLGYTPGMSAYPSCSVVAPASCYPWGIELLSGQSISYFDYPTVFSPGVCTGGTFTCSNGALLGYTPGMNAYQTCSAIVLATNGSCGSAHNGSFVTAPTSNLCGYTSATPTVFGSGPWSWMCTGSGTGNNVWCSAAAAPGVVNGSCGSANGGTFATAPSTNLCSAGTQTGVFDIGYWSWGCQGSGGTPLANCAANKQAGAVPPTVTFVANPNIIQSGNSSLLTWNISGVADSCVASGGWTGSKSFTTGLHTESVSPTTDTTYNLECWNAGISSGLQSVTVQVTPVSAFSCTSIPANSDACPGDNTGLSADTLSSVVTTCGAPKCEYTCSSGYTKVGSSCQPSAFSCTGIPANSNACPGDSTGLLANTPSTVVTACGAPKCEYTCDVGYVKSGNVCRATACNNGGDDDGDTLYDLADPGCTSILDDDESNSLIPAGATTINATPRVVNVGDTTTLNWNLNGNAPGSCTITANGLPSGFNPALLTITTSPLSITTTYVLTCGSYNDWVKVEVQGYGTET